MGVRDYWNEYNAAKQREYRRKRGLKRAPYKPKDGKCVWCGMLTEEKYHVKYPCEGHKSMQKLLKS